MKRFQQDQIHRNNHIQNIEIQFLITSLLQSILMKHSCSDPFMFFSFTFLFLRPNVLGIRQLSSRYTTFKQPNTIPQKNEKFSSYQFSSHHTWISGYFLSVGKSYETLNGLSNEERPTKKEKITKRIMSLSRSRKFVQKLISYYTSSLMLVDV